MKALSGRTKAFNSSFCPYSIKEWCSLREEIGNIVSVNKFRKIILSFIRTKEDSVFAIHDTKVLKLLTRLRLNFSRLNMNIYLDMVLGIQLILCGKRNNTSLSFALQAVFY